jgi:hypothetical protein
MLMQCSETAMVKRDRRLMGSYPCSFRGFAKRSDCPELWRSKTWVNPVVTAGAQVRRRLLDAGAMCQRVAAGIYGGRLRFSSPIEIGRLA